MNSRKFLFQAFMPVRFGFITRPSTIVQGRLYSSVPQVPFLRAEVSLEFAKIYYTDSFYYVKLIGIHSSVNDCTFIEPT